MLFKKKFSPKDIFSLLLERERGRVREKKGRGERERISRGRVRRRRKEKHRCERETSIGCLLVYAPTRD